MAEARTQAEWGRTASVMALIANCHRNPRARARPYTPKDFMPGPPRPSRKSHVSVERLTRDVLAVVNSRQS